jgi:putative toxin-antitoxin system antitoxin component (TIGR02293 family)
MEWLETANALGGTKVLGGEVTSGASFVQKIEQGLPIGALAQLKEYSQLTEADLSEVIPRRTLTSLWSTELLSAEQSDRVARIAGVFVLAHRIFADVEAAREWLLTPNAALQHELPLRLLRTGSGADVVESVLTRIEHGVYE